ncbi:MAG: putative selenate ABC transporter substrate-binding protein [Verrucomicrobiae bacterium]|nr:putative selenate ABC transporter substrate-binding protein [Verrucomicrobiae bacterium]NNJ87208.1 putative selenate ABC transporter substrate-binding protein [Akkermansiaceae bacterium]
MKKTHIHQSAKVITMASILAGAIALSSCGKKEETEQVLRFSAIPDENTTAQAEQYAPVAKWMSEKLGVKVEFVPSASYSDSVDKFSTGDIQLAWFGGVSGVQAREAVEGSKAIIAGEKDLAFKSYFIANASTGLEKSADFPTGLKGLTFTFGSNSSTSGCIMPSHFIIENTKVKPAEYFSKIGYSGAHDKTALTVQDGTFQAGAMSFSAYERMVKEGKIDPEKCRVIWETPLYADYNFTASGKLDKMFGEGFTEKLKKALLECDDPAVLKAFTRKKFVEVENSTFQGIADVMKSL